MKKLLLIIYWILILPSFVYSQSAAYQAGEKVEYIIHYGVVNAGVATLELQKDTFAGKNVLRSVFVAHTTGLADALFKVRDIFESDITSFFLIIRQGKILPYLPAILPGNI
jgi:hypothetical protein